MMAASRPAPMYCLDGVQRHVGFSMKRTLTWDLPCRQDTTTVRLCLDGHCNFAKPPGGCERRLGVGPGDSVFEARSSVETPT